MSAHTAKESRTALSAALLRAAGILEKTRPLCSAGNTATMCLFMLMVLLTFLDVFLRYFFNRPISGTVEFTELLMVIMYFSGLAKAQWDEAHVSMDIITGRLGPKGKARLGFATDTWSLAVLAWCMYALCRYALAREDWATSTWYIPCAPFLLFAAFGCFMCALAVLRDMLVKLAAVLEVEFSEIEFGGLVEVDDRFATRVPGLYNACVFYSFSGALCGGYAAGENAARGMAGEMPGWPDEDFEQERERVLRPLRVRHGVPQREFEAAMRQVMSCYMGMVRNERGMKLALEKLERIGASASRVMAEGRHELMLAHESMFLLESARLAVLATIERRETGRSIYRRSDYPELNPAMNRPLAVWNESGTPCTGWL